MRGGREADTSGAHRYGSPAPRGPAAESRTNAGLWASLEALYLEYCREQARQLLRLLPRDAIRPLYQKALEWAEDEDATDRSRDVRPDPMDLLEDYCRKEVLPLPPFTTWAQDYLGNRQAYLMELERAPRPAREGTPVDVDLRELDWSGTRWTATLRIRQDQAEWRGSVAFRSSEGQGAVTGEVFREASPFEVRDRFRVLEDTTLRAFLRSALPFPAATEKEGREGA